MVARNIALPNIRKQFIPDPDYLIIDADLAGADAQVVAWEANDEKMKEAFRKGIKIHVQNAWDMYPKEYGHLTVEEVKEKPIYKQIKVIVHGTNYGGKPPTIASDANVRWPVSEVSRFQDDWFRLRPGIKEWHNRTERFLDGTQCWKCHEYAMEPGLCENCGALLGRTVGNAFGYRIIFEDHISNLFNEALAWVPQSTVAIVTERGMLKIEDTFDFVEILLQVHDSLVFQIPRSEESTLPEIKRTLDSIKVPYPDPLYIPWGMAVSEKSWGLCG